MSTTPLTRRSLLRLAGVGAAGLLLGACGDDPGAEGSGIDWWHIANTDPMLTVWAELAKEYQAQHPDTKITVTPLENEAYKARLTTVTQAGDPPDIFHTWGGGVLKQQVDAGLAKDLSDDLASIMDTFTPAALKPYTLDGKLYAVPFDVGMVGFWYNKELFARAGITAAPATWPEFLDHVGKLKAAGITPIALAGADKWPGHYYWAYLAMRVAGVDALAQAGVDGKFDQPDFVAAGARLKELVDLQPFQKGFLGAAYGTPDGQSALMGNGGAAMELMGQWAPNSQKTSSGKGIGDKLGFFPFPAVPGGKGAITDGMGGGGGFVIGKNAPSAALEVVRFLVNVDNQRKAAATGSILPAVKDASDAVKDPHQMLVAQTLASTTGFQLYLDQAFPPTVGQEINDSVAQLIAGKWSPEQVVKAVADVAQR